MHNKKRGESKKSVLILISVILILSINIVSAERLPTVGGDTDNWGTILNEYLSKALGDNATTLNITGNAEVSGDLHMGGALTHDSPVMLREGMEIVTVDGTGYQEAFHIFISNDEEMAKDGHIGLTNATNLSLIFFTHNLANPYKMGYMFYDDVSNRSDFVISQGGTGRASIFDRSLQIGKSLGSASIDENYTLCQGFNLIDCNTGSTGADLGVEDDIEAKGSLFIQENINATGNFSLGQKITFAFGEIIDNIVDGWIRITGNLNVTGNITSDWAKFNNLNVTGTSYLGNIIIEADNITTNNIISKDGNISFYNNTGSEKMIITSDGNVGIGTVSPDKLLHINTSGGNELQYAIKLQNPDNTNGNSSTGILFKVATADGINSKAGIVFERTKSSGRGKMHFLLNDVNDGTAANISHAIMTITRGGGVGIGTTSPSQLLTISQDGSSGGFMSLVDEQTNGKTLYINNGWTSAGGAGMAGFYFTDKQIMTFNQSSGYVGIGTTSPEELLHLFGNNAAVILTDDSGNYARIKVGNSQLTLEVDPDNAIASTDMVFKMDGNEVARFYQGGNFGIGTITTGGNGQLSLGESSEEGCFRYNSISDGLEFSHQCDNNFSLISDAGFYGSLKWDATTDCAVGTSGGFTTPTAFTPDADCDDKARTSRGLTTSNLAVGNAEGRVPKIKFDSLPAGYYNVILHGNFRADPTGIDCSYMMTIDSGAINSSLTGMTAATGSAGMSPVVSALLYVPTDRGASTIELFGGESAANCRIQITSAELEITVYYYPQYNSTTGADYAEWFEKENELILAGDLIGLNVETGKVRVWRYADPIVGIASNNPSIAGNYKLGIEKTHALVGLVGQLNLNDPRTITENRLIYAPDGQLIGYRLADGKVYLSIGDGVAIQDLKSENDLLREELCQRDDSYSWC